MTAPEDLESELARARRYAQTWKQIAKVYRTLAILAGAAPAWPRLGRRRR